MEIGVCAASGLVLLDVAEVHIAVKESDGVGQVVGLFLCELVEAVDINRTNAEIEKADAGVPVPRTADFTLKVSTETEEVATVFIVGTRDVSVIALTAVGGVVVGLIAVEAVEVAHLIGQIGEVDTEAVVGDEILGVIGEAKDAKVFGCVCSFGVERVKVLGIGGAIAKIVDVCQRTVLETKVGVEGDTGQHAKSPTLTDMLLTRRKEKGKR